MNDLQRADHYATRGLSQEAISLYKKLINKNNSNAIDHLYEYYHSLGQINDAILLVKQQLESQDSPKYRAYVAESLQLKGDYQESLDTWKYIADNMKLSDKNHARVQKKIKELDEVIKLISSPLSINARPLNNGINTPDDEYQPQFSIDGHWITFTRLINGQEDIYIGRIAGDSIDVRPISNLNTKYNEGAHSLSADGSYIVFTHCNERYGQGSCDLYEIKKTANRWQKPRAISENINSPHWESQPSLSADGKYLYFASNRPGGMGGSDIWVSKWSDGGWQKPTNLGIAVNTPQDEAAPFIHPDGKTLYFSSNGHVGLGKSDFFLARRIGKDTWSKATNLGSPLNNKNDQRDIAISLDGQSGYFSTYDSADVNIYQFDLPISLRPAPMTFVAFEVLDKETGETIDAEVVIKTDAGREVFEFSNGKGVIAIPALENVNISVSKDNYAFYSAHVMYDSVAPNSSPITDIIELEPLYTDIDTAQETAPIVLNNIFFASGSADLLSTSDTEIEFLYQYMVTHPNPIRIIGHTDGVGEDSDNLTLSKMRADAVKNALIIKGIDAQRITAIGMGEEQPIANNSTAKGRQLNRRTEVVIIKRWREENK